MNKRISIVGSGFSGLSAASVLAHRGFEVDVFEKNSQPGGRASKFQSAGFTFDMGPTWYWMPDVFERYFSIFGKKVEDYYLLTRLDPSYRMFFGQHDFIDIPASLNELYTLFEQIEPGSSNKLKIFLKDAELKYNIGIKELVYKPGKSIFEFLDFNLIKGISKLDFFKSMTSYITSKFKDPRIIKILEFPVIFLGATPSDTPALYSLMNYADLSLGTWYPMGGMHKVVEAMTELASSFGANIHYNSEIQKIDIEKNKVKTITLNGSTLPCDILIGSGDYQHIEHDLLDEDFRTYTNKYWQSRKLAPSALLFFLGVNKKIKNLLHHNLLFDQDFSKHADEIYKHPQWPANPAIYVSVSSKTDPTVAPIGFENLIILIPVAPGLHDTDEIRERYYDLVMDRLEFITGDSIKSHVIMKRTYAHRDFEKDYHAYKGNAYGLANTLFQTAIFKPKMKSKKVDNLFYCGQLTVPGPGVPPSIISGEIAANLVVEYVKTKGL
jgi:phytoene desaturase